MAVDLSVSYRAPATARAMAEAATRFLASLNPAQRKVATFPFAGDERYTWNYRPTQGGDSRFFDRNGLRIMNMTKRAAAARAGADRRRDEQAQRRAGPLDHGARERSCASTSGPTGGRSSACATASCTGSASSASPAAQRPGPGGPAATTSPSTSRSWTARWSRRRRVSWARIRPRCASGRHEGKRALPEEEDLPRALVQSLEGAARQKAVFSEDAPQDIMTDAYRSLDRFILPRGVAYSASRRRAARQAGRHRQALHRPGQRRDRRRRSGTRSSGPGWTGSPSPGAAPSRRAPATTTRSRARPSSSSTTTPRTTRTTSTRCGGRSTATGARTSWPRTTPPATANLLHRSLNLVARGLVPRATSFDA